MRLFKSTIFRALCAIAVGYMLVQYPEQMQENFIRVIGAIFFTSGAIAWAAYIYQKRHAANVEIYDADGNRLTPQKPFFPIAGSGSIILGLVLITVPATLIEVLNIIFGAMVMLGAFNEFLSLMQIRKYSRVPVIYWLFTSFIFIIGLLIVLKPTFLANLFLQLAGWCFIAYAFLEILIAVQLAIYKRQYEKANSEMMIEKANKENENILNQ